MRCATVIDIVLKITKAPTKSAMPANESRKYSMIRMNWLTSSLSSLACSVPVLHGRFLADRGVDPRDELLGRHTVGGRRLDRVERVLAIEQALRGGDVEDRERRRAERLDVAVPGEPDDGEGLAPARGRRP